MKCHLLAALLFLNCLFLPSGSAFAQEPVDREIIAKIRDEALKRARAWCCDPIAANTERYLC